MKKLITLLLISSFLLSCTKEKPLSSTNLVGEWSWITTCGGFVGCVTPATEHHTIRITFNSDSTFSMFQNDSVLSSGNFSTLKVPADDGISIHSVVKMGDAYNVYSIHNDTLALSMMNVNIGSVYTRIK